MADSASLYETLHSTHAYYGRTANKLLAYILPFVKEVAPKSILDFGCGKSALCEALAAEVGAKPIKYDPAIPEISQKPAEQADMLINNDVLEHLPEADLDAVLAELRGYSNKALFTISTVLADVNLANGENAHCTVHPPEWWRDRLVKHFGAAYQVPTRSDTACAFTTWRPSQQSIDEAQQAVEQEKRRQQQARRVARWKNTLRLLFTRTMSREALLAGVRGKTVAVVGNASSLAGTEYGAEIDSHDIVVRFNAVRIPHTKSHGEKTDWIATAVAFNAALATKRGVKNILWMTPSLKNLPAWMLRGKFPLYLHPPAANKNLGERLGAARPTSGLMLVDLLMSSPDVKSVTMYGFDFFATPSLNGRHTAATAPHDFAKEAAFVNDLAARDARLSIRK